MTKMAILTVMIVMNVVMMELIIGKVNLMMKIRSSSVSIDDTDTDLEVVENNVLK